MKFPRLPNQILIDLDIIYNDKKTAYIRMENKQLQPGCKEKQANWVDQVAFYVKI